MRSQHDPVRHGWNASPLIDFPAWCTWEASSPRSIAVTTSSVISARLQWSSTIANASGVPPLPLARYASGEDRLAELSDCGKS